MLLLCISRFLYFVADLVLKLLNRNVDVNYKDRDGRSPLWYALNNRSYFSFFKKDAISCLLTKIPAKCTLAEILLSRGAEPLQRYSPRPFYAGRYYDLITLISNAVQDGRLDITTPVILNAVKQYIDVCSETGMIDWNIRINFLYEFIRGDLNHFEKFKILFPMKIRLERLLSIKNLVSNFMIHLNYFTVKKCSLFNQNTFKESLFIYYIFS